jgi:translocation and assembly module TamA
MTQLASRAPHRLASLALAALAVLGSGCAALRGQGLAAQSDAASTATAASSATAPVPRVQVEAPSDLRPVLERYLDISRLTTVTREAISEAEWQRLIDAVPAQARELLMTEGYFRPHVRAELLPATPGEPRAVRVRVEPGPQARIGDLRIEFEGPLLAAADAGDPRAAALRAELTRAWPLPRGAGFRNPSWNEGKAQLLARLRASGYASATWSGTAAEVDLARDRVRLFLVADSGPLFRSGEIEVTGLQVHEVQTVRNLANFQPGTPLTEALLLDYQERLQKSGLFENVSVSHDTELAQADRATVRVNLREQTLQVYTVAVGFSANTGERATVEHVHRRLFGLPLRSRSYVELGRRRSTLDFELSTHPFAGLERNVLGVAVERLETSTDVVLSQRLRGGRAWDSQTFERLVFLEAERGSRRSGGQPAVETLALSGNVHVVARRLDSVVLPTQGYTLALQAGLGRSRGDDALPGWFARSHARLTGYAPLGAQWYGQARVELGQVFRKQGVSAPDSQLFRAGGDESVRGYGYRELAPLDAQGNPSGGAVLFTTSVELARPFSARLPSLWGAVFVDAGRAANSFGDLKPALGVGLGLRWRSPVGPLRLDWAWAKELRRSRLHFSIGIAL